MGIQLYVRSLSVNICGYYHEDEEWSLADVRGIVAMTFLCRLRHTEMMSTVLARPRSFTA
jgi:hypothetical protein